MFASSSLQVRFLKVFERTNYPVSAPSSKSPVPVTYAHAQLQVTKWVRYITRAGTYQIRM